MGIFHAFFSDTWSFSGPPCLCSARCLPPTLSQGHCRGEQGSYLCWWAIAEDPTSLWTGFQPVRLFSWPLGCVSHTPPATPGLGRVTSVLLSVCPYSCVSCTLPSPSFLRPASLVLPSLWLSTLLFSIICDFENRKPRSYTLLWVHSVRAQGIAIVIHCPELHCWLWWAGTF